MKWEQNGKVVVVQLPTEVNSYNAPKIQDELFRIIGQCTPERIELDAADMKYISSAGMRVLINIRKSGVNVRVFNVDTDVYEIFSITGFTEIISVETRINQISVAGCEKLGEGYNGIVYRLNDEQVVKVFRQPDALEDIRRERDLARVAFMAGINTAIPFAVVTVENGLYGSVFEMLRANSAAQMIRQEPQNTDMYVGMLVELLRSVHRQSSTSAIVPSAKNRLLSQITYLEQVLDSQHYQKLLSCIQAIPESANLIHGDFQLNNILISNGEPFLLDMDSFSKGVPLLEFASTYVALQGYYLTASEYFNLSFDTLSYVWKRLVQLYWRVEDITEIEDRCKLIAMARILRRTLRRDAQNTHMIEYSRNTLISLLEKYDTGFLADLDQPV